MGWSCCNSYWNSIGAKTGLMIKKFNKENGTNLVCSPIKPAQVGHDSREGVGEYRPDDCTRVTEIKIPLNQWSTYKESEEFITASFSCACQRARKPDVIRHKGYSLYIRYTKRKLGKYFKVLVSQDKGTQKWTSVEGYGEKEIVEYIRKSIDEKTLVDIYGNKM